MWDQYWDYYRPDYPWTDDDCFTGALDDTRQAFLTAGYSDAQTEALINSGYVVYEGIVMDRCYGGYLRSTDGRTRLTMEHFLKHSDPPARGVRIHTAHSVGDLRDRIEQWNTSTSRRLLFRGQTDSYTLDRPRPNPFFRIEGMGEVSLLPSLWRKMFLSKKMGRQYFRNLLNLEWQPVTHSVFDLAEIERRREAALAAGEWMYSAQDMEDSDDPLLHRFGQMELDLSMGSDFNLATPLQTLLQHYGLLSPVLDLTSDLDVAMFFATHRYRINPDNGRSGYERVGTNERKAVLYVLREDQNEMAIHGRERLLEDLNPLRPKRQACVVCRTGPDAMNLAADYLMGVIRLDFDDVPPSRCDASHLFPDSNEDRFLAALKVNLRQPERVTDFSMDVPPRLSRQ
jgi:hypothetical protein